MSQKVIGLDNLSTGCVAKILDVEKSTDRIKWRNFKFIQGDIRDARVCQKACVGVDYVLHQAALGSVPRSINDPIATNQSNVDGFLNMLVAARDNKVRKFIYAASSSTYGDHESLPKIESNIGKPLSPYAVTKLVNELYADVFSRNYGLNSIGLRYFNVFGRRQDPNGSYAAVIPKWINAFINNELVYINGDGETSRDFCYVENVVQANLLAALTSDSDAVNQVYNIAVGERTSLNMLYWMINEYMQLKLPNFHKSLPVNQSLRPGDVRHSLADIGKAMRLLDYKPSHSLSEGLSETIDWYINRSQLKIATR